MDMTDAAEKKRGRKFGFRKKDPLEVSKGIRFTKAEFAGIEKAREITGEKESDFMRDAVDAKVRKTLKKAGIDINSLEG